MIGWDKRNDILVLEDSISVLDDMGDKLIEKIAQFFTVIIKKYKDDRCVS